MSPPVHGQLYSDPNAKPNFDSDTLDVRASHIPIPRGDLTGELWVGGSYTLLGKPLDDDDLRESWLVDCAGELPPDYRARASGSIMRVFGDIDAVPTTYDRIELLAHQLALQLRGEVRDRATAEDTLPAGTPERIYVLCKQGMNRSALLAGRVMRLLDVPAEQTVELLRAQRPGALSNQTFVDLIHS
ncbi:MAG TPA: hypothetical protein QGI71_08795 [Dehalococcoidia bacterium]|nr:hypothetical protein [Dehalococcoidia bacterium]